MDNKLKKACCKDLQDESWKKWLERGVEMFTNHVAVPLKELILEDLSHHQIQLGDITLRLECGDITKVKADAVANSINKSFNLKDGKLSSHLLRKAGEQLQEECNGLTSPLENDVIRTSAHNLKCKKIYHCCCPQKFSIESLKGIIRKCLEMAVEDKFSSIAISALGTGGLRYPPEDVIATMVTAIAQFSTESQATPFTLRSIAIVVFNKEESTIQAFNSYFKEFHGRSTYQCPSTPDSYITQISEKLAILGGGIRRSKSDFPSEWRKPLDVYQEVELVRGSAEWKSIESNFLQTLSSKAIVLKITRIQNPQIYEMYNIQRRNVTTALTKSDAAAEKCQKYPAERTLWHGTSKESISKITRQNFDRGAAGRNGTQYGFGCYFSTTSEYSDGYSSKEPKTPVVRRSGKSGRQMKADYQPPRHMIRARVLTGEYTAGSSTLKTAPYKSIESGEQYDSVVNNLRNPSIFVTFKDMSTYPEYIISYQKLK